MNKKAQILVQVAPQVEGQELFDEMTQLLSPSDSLQLIESERLDGLSVHEWILTLGASSGIVAQLSQVLVAWINSQGKRSIKINGVELTGYKVQDVKKLLQDFAKENLESDEEE